MSVKKIVSSTIALIIVGGFIYAGVVSATNTKDKLDFKTVELKSKNAEIKELNIQYDQVNKKLDEALKQKNTNQSEIEKLRKEKAAADKERDQLRQKLEARAEAKAKVASASIKNAPVATSGSIQEIIISAANKYGVSSGTLLRVAQCESQFTPTARNPEPVIINGVNYGHAEGLFQYIPGTWARMSAQAGYAGALVTNAVANANVTAWAFANGHAGEWQCQ